MDTREFCKKFAAKSAKLDPKDVEIRRARVITEIQSLLDDTKPLTIDNINEVMAPKVLNGAVDSIDKHFFENNLKSMFESKKKRCCFSICMENECMILKGTKIAGNCKIDSKGITINLSTKVLQESFKTERKKREVGKVPCTDILSCLLLILEHELVHALIQCDCPYSKFDDRGDKLGSPVEKLKIDVATSHSSTFMAILNNRFNHKDFYVNILGGKFDKEDFKVGDIIGVRKRADFPNFKTGKKFAKFKSVEVTGVSSSGVKVTLTDKGVIRGLFGGELYNPVKHMRVDLGLIPFENVVNKLEPIHDKQTVTDKPKSPVKKASPPKPVSRPISRPVVKPEPKKNTVKKPACNKRNPAPPCPEGMIIKKRPNGEECCYKSAVKTKKVSPVPKPVAKPASPPKLELKNLEPSFDFVSKPHSVEVIDSELNYKQLKPETRKYIDLLPRLKLNKKTALNTSDLFPTIVPNHLILKVGVKYLLVDTQGSSYVRYATKILNIPTPSKGFVNIF
jgi:hypothetical protein